ncbi:MAG TPA: NAD(P)H-quinone oxidoreductase [Acidimicrobiia bacterium]|nr:NAD(P)H-quinone oxidoreductase [Acidimicrobiia bacterium]
MRALTIADGGRLAVEDRERPRPGPGEVLVRVHGAGLNRADLLQRAGRYPPPTDAPPDVPGLEFAGVVEETGPGVTEPAAGDRVFGIVGGGAQAEYVRTRAEHCAAVPESLDLRLAGGVPETFMTAHDALVTQARLQPGERVLVHAVGSGVGTAVVQLASAWKCPTVGTARHRSKLEAADGLGLTRGVLAPSPFDAHALAQQITEVAGPCDVTIDLVGGSYLETDVHAAAPRGRIVLVGTLAGGSSAFPILVAMGKRLTVMGTVLRARSNAEKAEVTDAFAVDVAPLLGDGGIAPVVDEIVPLADAERAYERLASDETFGKVILDCT